MQTRQDFDPDDGLARLLPVHCDNLIPHQHPTPLKLLKACDCYEFHCLKYPGVATFHSFAEFIHALLLEANSSVVSFVPQPFKLRLAGRIYIPDVFVFSQDGVQIHELTPRGEFDSTLTDALSQFFLQHNMEFKVISNESALDRESSALNWLPIVQVLVQAKRMGLETQKQEQQLIEYCFENDPVCVGDLLDPGQRESQWHIEVALYRLLHQHRLEAHLESKPIDYNSVLLPCT